MIPRAVIALVVTDRTDDGIFVGHLSQLGHVLADLNTRDVGFNRFEFATNLTGSFRLQVKRLQVCRSTIHPNQNATAGLATWRQFGSTRLTQPQQLAKTSTS
jgi:hypothetical protein